MSWNQTDPARLGGRFAPYFVVIGLAVGACGSDADDFNYGGGGNNNATANNNGTGQVGQPLANFMLLDTNSTSMRAGQMVSPRDYLTKVTGWYFTESS